MLLMREIVRLGGLAWAVKGIASPERIRLKSSQLLNRLGQQGTGLLPLYIAEPRFIRVHKIAIAN